MRCLKCNKELVKSQFYARRKQLPIDYRHLENMEDFAIQSCRYGCGVSFLYTLDGEFVCNYYLMNKDFFYLLFRNKINITEEEAEVIWKEDYKDYLPKYKFMQDFRTIRKRWLKQGCPPRDTFSLTNPEQNTLFEEKK